MRGGPDRPRPASPTPLRPDGGGRTGPGLQGRRGPGRRRPGHGGRGGRETHTRTTRRREACTFFSSRSTGAAILSPQGACAVGESRHRLLLRMRGRGVRVPSVRRAAPWVREALVGPCSCPCPGVCSHGGDVRLGWGSPHGAGAPGWGVGYEASASGRSRVGIPGPAASAGGRGRAGGPDAAPVRGTAPRAKPGERPAGLAVPCGPGGWLVPRGSREVPPEPSSTRPWRGGRVRSAATALPHPRPSWRSPARAWESSSHPGHLPATHQHRHGGPAGPGRGSPEREHQG